jgi:hypothetical protein
MSEAGRALAAALAGSWREPPPPLHDDEARALDAELAIRTGAAGLVHRRLAAASTTSLGRALGEAWRVQILDEKRMARQLEACVTALLARGIAAVVLKGWAAARAYPGPGLRPSTDLDLAIAPRELEPACEALVGVGACAITLPDGVARPRALVRPPPDALGVPIDLHLAPPRLDDRDAAARARRLVRAPLGATFATVLGDEDHLRATALHLFDHTTRRTNSLVDLAVLVEQRGPALDWAYLLDGDRRRTEAVVVALALARHLLGARLEDTPLADRTARLPAWIPRALLAQWCASDERGAVLDAVPLRPSALADAARRRFRNPLVATFAVGGRFDDGPRLPYQMVDFLMRGGRYVWSRMRR